MNLHFTNQVIQSFSNGLRFYTRLWKEKDDTFTLVKFCAEVIFANDLTVTKAALLLGISRQSLNNIIHEKSDITFEMSFRIAKVFGGTADIRANLQTKFSRSHLQ